jgi:hypothetical protein
VPHYSVIKVEQQLHDLSTNWVHADSRQAVRSTHMSPSMAPSAELDCSSAQQQHLLNHFQNVHMPRQSGADSSIRGHASDHGSTDSGQSCTEIGNIGSPTNKTHSHSTASAHKSGHVQYLAGMLQKWVAGTPACMQAHTIPPQGVTSMANSAPQAFPTLAYRYAVPSMFM